MINILLLILITIIVLIVIQFDLNGKITYNAISNTGSICVKLLGLKIINKYFSFKKGYIEIISKNKQKLIPFVINRESIKEVSKLDDFIFSKIYFKKVNVYFNYGIKDKAFETALLGGLINTIVSNLLIKLKNSKNEVLESIKVYNEFDKTIFNFALKCKISISLIDLVWCFAENIAYKQIYKNSIENFDQTKK